MHIIANLLLLAAGCKWGDWRHWREYYPTILFFMTGDLLYGLLVNTKPMWLFHDLILPNHTTISLLSMTVGYSATVLIYLGRFPEGWKKRFIWFLFWVGLYAVEEFINSKLGFITYHNGWNFGWSFLFTCIIFLILPIHHKRPLIAWFLSIIVIITLLNVFDLKCMI